MASAEIGRAPTEKGAAATSAPKLGEQHHDVEVGPEMINIDRIEKVYAWVHKVVPIPSY
jgi:hypothetical protein